MEHGLNIFLWGLAITVLTYIFMGKNFVKFGVLHSIGISIIILIPIAGKKWANLLISLITIPLGFYLISRTFESNLFFLGFVEKGFSSLDYYPLLPWTGFVCFGIFVGNTIYNKGKRNFAIFENKTLSRISRIIGSNTLAIYLLHQPILFGIMFAISHFLYAT